MMGMAWHGMQNQMHGTAFLGYISCLMAGSRLEEREKCGMGEEHTVALAVLGCRFIP